MTFTQQESLSFRLYIISQEKSVRTVRYCVYDVFVSFSSVDDYTNQGKTEECQGMQYIQRTM